MSNHFAPQGGYSPAARYAAIGLCTTAVVGCGLALYYRRQTVKTFALSGRLLTNPGAPVAPITVAPSEYPKVRRDESVVETLHGVSVSDPYRWLEDPDSEETRSFVSAQNALTSKVLESCETRDKFSGLMKQLFDYPRYGCPFKRGSRYYYSHNSGLQAQNVIYTQKSVEAEATVLLDPNKFSEDGTVALEGMKFSEDGSLLAYELAKGGSDWHSIKIMGIDAATGKGKDLQEELHHIKFNSTAWTHDNKGFFYNRYPAPSKGGGDLGTETDANKGQQLWYHVVGAPQSSDAFLLDFPDQPEWMASAEITDDGRFLLVSISMGCEPSNQLWYLDLQRLPTSKGASSGLDFSQYDKQKGASADALPLNKLIDEFEAAWEVLANEGTSFTLMTNQDAPRYRIVRGDIAGAQSPKEYQDLIPQHDTHLLQWACAMKGDALVVCYLQHARSKLQRHSLASGQHVGDVPLPGLGSVREFSGRRRDSEAFFLYTDFTVPAAIYRFRVDGKEEEPKLFRQAKLKVDNFSPDQFESHQVFVTSPDGTKVPMFIVHKKGISLDGSNTTLLYGYGGFNISLEPSFSVARLCFMLAYNGVFAMANLRGGGEYGLKWRNSGSLHNKQNVFDDFAACAEHLTASNYCSASKLIIQGGSNGGLLVAACANQRPDLFACGIAQVGVHDMLRFHKFTIGHAWITDFGNPDKMADFEYLMTYSPIHNVRVPSSGSRQHPAMLLTSGDHDDRVVPLHTHKLLATLQHTLAGSGRDSLQRNPLLARYETKAGHGAGKPTEKIIAEYADIFGFAAAVTSATWAA
ncbi:hypothetical protein WJX73_000704 [Symbiochloris irregularis]|uniref:Prolyl endopeptidase n=1 Tax=Symbiochloris irregularis TaxID=706552 RepID=A0AAW1NT60_9CHLO